MMVSITSLQTWTTQYSLSMHPVYIFVDNLRIGGFQRLALDQAYALSDRGFSPTIFVLDDPHLENVPSFLNSEMEIIVGKGVSIKSLGRSRTGQISAINELFSQGCLPDLLLSHSLRATSFLLLVSLRRMKNLKTISTIHQLPTLSAPRQRFQRFLYASLSWRLLAYSVAVQSDWESRIESNLMLRLLFGRKQIAVLRNGIYLERLPRHVNVSNLTSSGRLIFLGRNTAWKGIATFLEVASQPALSSFEILFMIPDEKDLSIRDLPSELQRRIQIVAGKSISSFVPQHGDVHLYPANYGPEAKYVESVSLNCLELACLGVPTVLTKGGLGTWPDLAEFSIFFETDWKDPGLVADQVIEVSEKTYTNSEIEKMMGSIDIQNQISNLLRISN